MIFVIKTLTNIYNPPPRRRFNGKVCARFAGPGTLFVIIRVVSIILLYKTIIDVDLNHILCPYMYSNC